MSSKPAHSRSGPMLWAGALLVLLIVVLFWPDVERDVIRASPDTQVTLTWGPVIGVTAQVTVVDLAPVTTPESPIDVFSSEELSSPPDPPDAPPPDVPEGEQPGDGTLRRIAVPVLMYHYISVPPEDADVYRLDLSVTPENFRAQMQYLADNGYNVINFYDLHDALQWGIPLPSRPVVLTFDDGYVDVYAFAFPILREFGFTGTFFVVTQRLDENHPSYLNWAQTREMVEAGMSIESHTKDHPDMRGRDDDFLYYQVVGSIESIEAHTGHRSRVFSFPAGRWDKAILESLPLFGIWMAVTTEGGIEHTTDAPYLMQRARVSGDTDLATFGALLEWTWDRSDS